MKRWLMVVVLVLLAGCGNGSVPSTTAIAIVSLNKVELQYLLRDYLTNGRGQVAVDQCDYEFGFFHEPDRFEQRGRVALQTLAQENPAGLALIQRTVGITGELATLNTEQTLALYQELRDLSVIRLSKQDNVHYPFATRILNNDGKLVQVEGTITNYGQIKISKQEPTDEGCPICKPRDTLPATPADSMFDPFRCW